MNVSSKIAAATATLALGLAPAAALAQGATTHGKSHNAPGHAAGKDAKAYGRYCQDESKKHVAGHRGTPFSDCVRDMAKLAKDSKADSHKVCANESKKHVAGQKGTPFSDCVSDAAKLRNDKTS
jgi:hypothetical protein